MQKYSQHNNDEQTQFFRKIYLSLYSKGLWKGYCVRGELETKQRLQHIDPLALPAIAALLSHSAGLLNRRPGGPVSAGNWFSLPRTATTDFKLWSPTNWLPVAPRLYHCLTPICFLWASHLHSVQPVDSQGYPLISLTGCSCYLHRCISYLTARPGRRSICYTKSNSFICTQLNVFRHWYVTLTIQFRYTVKEYQVLIINSNTSIHHYSFVSTQLKLFQVLLCITNNSIKHKSFVLHTEKWSNSSISKILI